MKKLRVPLLAIGFIFLAVVSSMMFGDIEDLASASTIKMLILKPTEVTLGLLFWHLQRRFITGTVVKWDSNLKLMDIGSLYAIVSLPVIIWAFAG